MARNNLHTVYPFRAGTSEQLSDWHYLTIEQETAKSRAGQEPFRVVWHAVGQVHEYGFTHVTDACAALPGLVADMTKNHSNKSDGTPRDWSHLARMVGGWAYENGETPLRKRGRINQMRADMGWSLERARLEYDADPAQRF
jgi:hypothetical protein